MVERLAFSRRFRRCHRLRRSADFLRCYRRGRRRYGSLVTLHFHSNEEKAVRLGVTASRKVGNSVIRHRVKRRVREVFRCWQERGDLPDLDLVVHLKPVAGRAEFRDLKSELERLFSELPSLGGSSNSPLRRLEGLL